MKSTVGVWQILSGIFLLMGGVSVFLNKMDMADYLMLAAIFCAISEISSRIRDKAKKE